MSNKIEFQDRTNFIVGFCVWAVVFIVYNLTKAPTLSFWDCGEFIAAATKLQIPHPPGSPFYILLGRLFAMLPIASDQAVRVNMLSVVSSSFTALFVYFSAVQVLRLAIQPSKDVLNQIIVYGGGVAGAMFSAFALTNWNNAVEAEVYGLSMMLLTAAFWMALMYWEKKGTLVADKLLYMIFFTTFLGVGVHLTTFLFLPVLSLFFIIDKFTSKHVWYLFGVLFLFELYLIFAFSSKPNEIPYYIPLVIVFFFFMFYIFSFEKIKLVYVSLGGAFVISLLPLITDLIAISGKTGYESLSSLFDIGGKIGFGILILLGGYFLYGYFKSKNTEEVKTDYLIASLFGLGSAFMVLFLYPFHGYDAYKPFLVLTAVLILLFLLGYKKHINWLNLIAIGGVSLVMIGVKPFFIGMISCAILIIILGIFKILPGWRNALMIIMVSFIGYSTHLYIPIRSQQNPRMNENNPGSSVQATIDYIERKQYGSMSMTERMFKRRGSWQNQFGTYQHMGFWGYFQEVYGTNRVTFLPFFIIGLFGIWEVVRKRPSIGVPLMLAIFLATIGLILYMNFADGTRINPQTGGDYLEVRDRDYFFTPAFIFFGLAIGIGFACIVHAVKEWTSKNISKATIPATIFASVLFLSPSVAMTNNYFMASRANNYFAYDYGWNLLTSADQNAIIFTVGDNDTFTLWCLQDALGIRTDVSVVNLSLANTKWYIKQLPTNLDVKTSWSEKQVDDLRPFRNQDGEYFGISDQVISEVIKENFKRRPINFSVTVGENRWKFYGNHIDSLMSLKGMVWRMNRVGGGQRIDIDSSIAFLEDPEQMRLTGINDSTIYKDATTLRLTKNYARTFVLVADSLQKIGETEKAENLVARAVAEIPHAVDAVYFLADMYSQNLSQQKLENLIETNTFADKNLLRVYLCRLYYRNNQVDKCEQEYLSILDESPSYRKALDDLLRLYYEQKDPEKMKSLIMKWLAYNPDDADMQSLLQSIDNEFRRLEQEQTKP